MQPFHIHVHEVINHYQYAQCIKHSYTKMQLHVVILPNVHCTHRATNYEQLHVYRISSISWWVAYFFHVPIWVASYLRVQAIQRHVLFNWDIQRMRIAFSIRRICLFVFWRVYVPGLCFWDGSCKRPLGSVRKLGKHNYLCSAVNGFSVVRVRCFSTFSAWSTKFQQREAL